MLQSFWQKLAERERPIVGLSPMDGVTDAVMRYMCAKYSRLDVMFTEFVSVDALHFATGARRARLLKTFIKAREVGTLAHRPYEVAQVFGHKPELFAEAAELVEELGFDGIDINMGCPAHKVEEQGSGAGLIRTPALAQEIIRTVKAHTKLPVSVKTRIGIERDVVGEWMEALMEAEPAMISLHGRTLRQLYQGTASWEAIGRAATVVHRRGGRILGNGDITSLADGLARIKEYGVDGCLIGRAAEGNPAFASARAGEADKVQRLAWIREHAEIFERIFVQDQPEAGDRERAFVPVRKHLAWYARGFPGVNELRTRLVLSRSREEVEKIVSEAV